MISPINGSNPPNSYAGRPPSWKDKLKREFNRPLFDGIDFKGFYYIPSWLPPGTEVQLDKNTVVFKSRVTEKSDILGNAFPAYFKSAMDYMYLNQAGLLRQKSIEALKFGFCRFQVVAKGEILSENAKYQNFLDVNLSEHEKDFSILILPVINGNENERLIMGPLVLINEPGNEFDRDLINSLWGFADKFSKEFMLAKVFACLQKPF